MYERFAKVAVSPRIVRDDTGNLRKSLIIQRQITHIVTCLGEDNKPGTGMTDGRSFAKGVKDLAASARVSVWHKTWPVSNWLAGRSQLGPPSDAHGFGFGSSL